jgi:hypothetical protein
MESPVVQLAGMINPESPRKVPLPVATSTFMMSVGSVPSDMCIITLTVAFVPSTLRNPIPIHVGTGVPEEKPVIV